MQHSIVHVRGPEKIKGLVTRFNISFQTASLGPIVQQEHNNPVAKL